MLPFRLLCGMKGYPGCGGYAVNSKIRFLLIFNTLCMSRLRKK